MVNNCIACSDYSEKKDELGKFIAWVESKQWWESSWIREVNGMINLISLTGSD